MHDFTHKIYFYDWKNLKETCILTQKMAWPPTTYDVISRYYSNWPSLNSSQNVEEGWTKRYWNRQALMFCPLGENSKNLMATWGGGIHHPLVRPRVRIMCVMSLVISCSLYNQTNFMKRNSHKFVRGVASFSTYVVGLAYFHFHISWKLHAWLVRTDLSNTYLTSTTHNLLQVVEWSNQKFVGVA